MRSRIAATHEALLEAADFGLFEALLLAGGVVIAVFLQVAQGAGLGDARGDHRAVIDEGLELGLDPFAFGFGDELH